MSPSVKQLPQALEKAARQTWAGILDFIDPEPSEAISQAVNSVHSEQLFRVLATSPFVADSIRRKPQLFLQLLQTNVLQLKLPEDAFEQDLLRALSSENSDLDRVLREFRSYHMLRIVWRDFTRLADTRETVRDVSLLAEASIRVALEYVQEELEARHGRPIGCDSGAHQQLIVLAMGKLGARELNVSSDIDLIFTFPESGQTDSDSKSISNEQFFTKVGQGLIAALDKNTSDGFVFRVDMRLRPYGDSGALAHNFAALEQYYQAQGRDWERYALIKANPVSGDAEQAAMLMDSLRPFVFRRYIDFGVIESLRSMKQMINAEVRRRGLQSDVKLGHGGIREVEFIAQCFQLIRGGRDLGLQNRELLTVLNECAELGCLPQDVCQVLRRAYLFLRDSEHAIQGYKDKQTQALPEDDVARQAMATVMGFERWQDYLAALDEHRGAVAGHFQQLIAEPEETESSAEDNSLWNDDINAEALLELGYRQPEESIHLLQELRSGPRVMTLQIEGKKRLEEFMPQLLRACAQAQDADLSLQRVLPLVFAVVRRSAYLALLMENPHALRELVVLCGASPWIAQQLAQHPVLLDELLDSVNLYSAPDRALLADELRQQVLRLEMHDLEAQMNALRYFKASHVLRVAASEISGRLPLMQVSDKLTWIAEVILEQVLAVAWADLSSKYGEPARPSSGYGFAIFGYGKLGGIELGYGSDLDLVFVYDGLTNGVTDGERSIDNTVFYTRLGQRIIHILDTRMSLGQLYEVDMRLRPDGDSGMLVSTVGAFGNYQKESAWTWEHQALVRARMVAGDPEVSASIDALRHEVLARKRDNVQLAADVCQMREKMRQHLVPGQAAEKGEFHLKQGGGGIVDIEFMVQYAVLAWSHQVPALTRWSDNVRILETLSEEGLFEQQVCDILTQSYLAYRCAAHQLALQQQQDIVPAQDFETYRLQVQETWQELFADCETKIDTNDLPI